jgi:DNA (cytosine-5)-methyltransferase 1/site-specific DNA-methyltransferase (adenine-specific)
LVANPAQNGSTTARDWKILDLFSGAGGFSYGLHMLPEFTTVAANDFMEDALKTYAFNMPEAYVVHGDITSESVKSQLVKVSRERGVNMIIGGPPCQGFSNKGKKLGLKDPRNFLFREYLELVKELQPEVFVIENVKAMSTSTSGWFMNEILTTIGSYGYQVSHGILTASDFGVPQARQRTFIIASKQFLVPLPDPTGDENVTVRDAISDLAYLESGEGADEMAFQSKPLTAYQQLMRNGAQKLYNHKATNHAAIALHKLGLIPPEMGKESLPVELLGNQKFKTTWGRLKWDSLSPTIDTRFDTPSNGTNSHPFLNRSITPREAARIQSFPDTFRFLGTKTNIGKQIGNAVPPLLARAVGNAILSAYTGSVQTAGATDGE